MEAIQLQEHCSCVAETALAACHDAVLIQSLEHHNLCSFNSLWWRCLQAPRCSITVHHCSKDSALPDKNNLRLLKAWEATLAVHLLMKRSTISSVGHCPHTCLQMQQALSRFITLQNRVRFAYIATAHEAHQASTDKALSMCIVVRVVWPSPRSHSSVTAQNGWVGDCRLRTQ